MRSASVPEPPPNLRSHVDMLLARKDMAVGIGVPNCKGGIVERCKLQSGRGPVEIIRKAVGAFAHRIGLFEASGDAPR